MDVIRYADVIIAGCVAAAGVFMFLAGNVISGGLLAGAGGVYLWKYWKEKEEV